MNIRFLETAVWLARLRSFRATAEKLHITQQAVSSRIQALEQELGIRLFERDAREVRPTSQGQSFIDGAQMLVSRYHDLVHDVSSTVVPRTFRLGIVPSMSMVLLPRLAATLRNRFPSVRLVVVTDNSPVLYERLRAGAIDIALMIKPAPDESLASLDLFTLGMFLVASPRIRFAHSGLPVTPAEIATHPLIAYEPGSINHARLLAWLGKRHADDLVVHYSNSLGTTINLTQAGMGVAVLPPVVIQRELRDGSLRALDVAQPFPSTAYSAVFEASSDLTLAAQVARIARDEAALFCERFDPAVAFQEPRG